MAKILKLSEHFWLEDGELYGLSWNKKVFVYQNMEWKETTKPATDRPRG